MNDCLELNLILKHQGNCWSCRLPSGEVSIRACADKRGGGEKSEPLLLTTSSYT